MTDETRPPQGNIPPPLVQPDSTDTRDDRDRAVRLEDSARDDTLRSDAVHNDTVHDDLDRVDHDRVEHDEPRRVEAVRVDHIENERQPTRVESVETSREPVRVERPEPVQEVVAPAPVSRVEPAPAPVPQPQQQRVFLSPPTAPKKKGNRLIGSLIALVSVVAFAALYAGVAALILLYSTPAGEFADQFSAFILSNAFVLPTILFVVGFVLVALLANRAGWWAYILGSLLVGAIVYFGTIGVQLLIAGVISATPREAFDQFLVFVGNPFVIAAGLVAREISLWVGSAIAARGRRIRSRNSQAREDYERAAAEHRAGYDGGFAGA